MQVQNLVLKIKSALNSVSYRKSTFFESKYFQYEEVKIILSLACNKNIFTHTLFTNKYFIEYSEKL